MPIYALAPGTHEAEVELGFEMATIRGLVEPTRRFDIVLRHAFAGVERAANIVLGLDVTLIGRSAIPNHRLGVVLRHAQAQLVHLAKVGLGFGNSLLGEWSPLIQCLGVVATLKRRLTFTHVRLRRRHTKGEQQHDNGNREGFAHDGSPSAFKI